MIDAETVIEIHDYILSTEQGLPGGHGRGPVEGALARIENRILYAELDDIFDIAAMYAVAIARGHVFTCSRVQRRQQANRTCYRVDLPCTSGGRTSARTLP